MRKSLLPAMLVAAGLQAAPSGAGAVTLPSGPIVGEAVQLVHGRRRGHRVTGPHCYPAWHRNRGWHRHHAWCNRHKWRDWRRHGRRGCTFGPGGFRCRF